MSVDKVSKKIAEILEGYEMSDKEALTMTITVTDKEKLEQREQYIADLLDSIDVNFNMVRDAIKSGDTLQAGALSFVVSEKCQKLGSALSVIASANIIGES